VIIAAGKDANFSVVEVNIRSATCVPHKALKSIASGQNNFRWRLGGRGDGREDDQVGGGGCFESVPGHSSPAPVPGGREGGVPCPGHVPFHVNTSCVKHTGKRKKTLVGETPAPGPRGQQRGVPHAKLFDIITASLP